MRKLVMAVGVGLAGIGVFTGISAGDDGSTRPDAFDRSFERVAVSPTDAPSASSAASAQVSAKGKPKVKYFATAPVPIPAAGADIVTGCPPKHKALSGFYVTDGAIVPDLSAVSDESPRDWLFGFVNLKGVDGQAILGVVCGKKL
jgi:hypothetical protein